MAKRKPATHVALNFRRPGVGVLCGATEFGSVSLVFKKVTCANCRRRVFSVLALGVYAGCGFGPWRREFSEVWGLIGALRNGTYVSHILNGSK